MTDDLLERLGKMFDPAAKRKLRRRPVLGPNPGIRRESHAVPRHLLTPLPAIPPPDRAPTFDNNQDCD